VLVDGVHLAVLWAFAVVQPLLDILGRNATFFVVRDASAGEIVLFGLALALVPPLVLTLAELVVGAIDRRLLRLLQLLLVGLLAAVLALTVVTRLERPAGTPALVTALVAGAAAVAVYARSTAGRSGLTLLAPVPLLFVALFLLHSPTSELVFPADETAHAAPLAAAGNPVPVVLILFDEFSTVSLLGREGRLDATRYPSFASLARDATWYRSNTSSYWLSEGSVPSILTGRLPDRSKTPVLADYPDNLFTLLGRSRRVVAFESITRMCPASICHSTPSTASTEASGGARRLASDTGIVYLHLVLPDPYVRRVASIDSSWGNFGNDAGAEPVSAASADIPACGRSICEFADSIRSDGKPSLYFLDSSLPHVPYVYLPSGKRYALDSRVLRGNDDGLWLDSWPTEQSYQRYLLQTGYTDRALGHVLAKLRSSGLYDRALVIVSADHGVSFKLGDQRRLPTATNLDDIAFVPLFVKLPGQKQGRIDDGLSRSIDILPTIARVTGLKVPWRVDGTSLVGRNLPVDGTVTMVSQTTTLTTSLSRLRQQRAASLARQVSLFGSGARSRLYRIGPNLGLLGRAVPPGAAPRAPGTSVQLEGTSVLANVDLASGLAPTYVEGTLTPATGPPVELAIAVNGRIAAVTRSFAQYGQRRFAAFVPESALSNGANALRVFVVRHGASGLVLNEPVNDTVKLRLTLRKGGEVITSTAGHSHAVRPDFLKGTVSVAARGAGYRFSGRARGPGSIPIQTIAVFDGQTEVFSARMGELKPVHLLGETALGKRGFAFELPASLLPPPGSDRTLRVFALRNKTASELHYDAAYPWPHRPSTG
jgi:hypothetical protein